MRRLFGVVLVLAMAACCKLSCGVTTAKIEDPRTCAQLDGHGECAADTATFDANEAKLHVVAKLRNALDGTEVLITWRYLEGQGVEIASVPLTVNGGRDLLESSLSRPTNGWPRGSYEVVLAVQNADNRAPVRKAFSIK